MFKRNIRITRTAIAFALAAGIAMSGSMPAFAEGEIVVAPGTLGITTAPTAGNFALVTLDGTTKSTDATFSAFEVNDSRGSGDGWKVTVSATPFAEYATGAYVDAGKTLDAGSLSLSAPAAVTADGTESAAPTLQTLPAAIDAGEVQIASAAVGAGMGKFDFDATTLTLSVEPDTYAKTYKSTITVTTATAP